MLEMAALNEEDNLFCSQNIWTQAGVEGLETTRNKDKSFSFPRQYYCMWKTGHQ